MGEHPSGPCSLNGLSVSGAVRSCPLSSGSRARRAQPGLFISLQTILGRFLQKHPSVEMLFFIISYACLLPEKHCFCFHVYAAAALLARVRWLMFLHPNLHQRVLKRIKCPNVMFCCCAARLSLPDRGQQ